MTWSAQSLPKCLFPSWERVSEALAEGPWGVALHACCLGNAVLVSLVTCSLSGLWRQKVERYFPEVCLPGTHQPNGKPMKTHFLFSGQGEHGELQLKTISSALFQPLSPNFPSKKRPSKVFLRTLAMAVFILAQTAELSLRKATYKASGESLFSI